MSTCWRVPEVSNKVVADHFKVEALYAEDVRSKQEAYSCVFEYIELFYNSHRRHIILGNKSPRAHEDEHARMCA